MKKFLFKLTIIILPLLILLILVNYIGDKGSLFQENYEKEMVRIIASGQNVTKVSHYNERIFHKELICSNHSQPNLVLLGSSRTMLINSESFPGYTLLNNSVKGAVIQDIISYYQLYKDNNKLPKKIVIGIDPWIFNENDPQKSWEYLSKYYNDFMGIKHHQFSNLSKYKQLLSFSYFQESFSRFTKVINGKKITPEPTENKYNSWHTILSDGSLVYNIRQRNVSLDEAEKKIKEFKEGGIYGLKFFHKISEKKYNDFEKLISDMLLNNIEIEFILIPFPPLVFDKIEEEYPIVLQTLQLINDFAKNNNIKVSGTYNPHELEMDNSFFIDGMHCNELGIQKVIETVQLLSN